MSEPVRKYTVRYNYDAGGSAWREGVDTVYAYSAADAVTQAQLRRDPKSFYVVAVEPATVPKGSEAIAFRFESRMLNPATGEMELTHSSEWSTCAPPTEGKDSKP